MRAVVKIGTSSITNALGELDDDALAKLGQELVDARAAGHSVTLVCSGAIAAGMPALGITKRPTDIGTLQAIAAVGQPRLMERISAILARHDVVAGQVLLTPYDFLHRSQYVHAARRSRDSWISAWCPSSTRTTPWPTTRSGSVTTTGSPRSSPT